MYTYIYVHECVCVCIHIYMYTHIYIYMYINTYVYVCKYIHVIHCVARTLRTPTGDSGRGMAGPGAEFALNTVVTPGAVSLNTWALSRYN